MNVPPPDVLGKIMAHKRGELAMRKQQLPQLELEARLSDAPTPRGFTRALQDRLAAGSAAVIAEIKKASPSKGLLRDPFDVAEIARSYQDHGATCLSVLTDQQFFKGSDENLTLAHQACGLPILRKDFCFDAYQVYEARAIGADCILLIAAVLDDLSLAQLTSLATELGMDVLIEVHEREEMQRVTALSPALIGINNRDLKTFATDLYTTLELKAYAGSALIVTESGIHSSDDVALMRGNDVHTFLVGEAFMRAPDPGAKLQELFATD